MTYVAPVDKTMYLLRSVVEYERVCSTGRYSSASLEMCEAILVEAARLAEQVLVPLNRVGDQCPAELANGIVRCPPGFSDGYRAIADGGWVGVSAPVEFGGMGLPVTLQMAVGEFLSSSGLSLALNPLMTQGQIEALTRHGNDWVRKTFLPKLISGHWTGTMNLTEPQAGSDVGALRCKAVDKGDGTYAITGQKCFISWGDHDLAENICHLVLARRPEAPEGSAGISMFMVPKFLPAQDGSPGTANRLRPLSLEKKLGMHGSPTAVMAFEGATGWLVGKPEKGLSAMFTMMNNARLGVAIQGLGAAEAAVQMSVDFALSRVQGRSGITNGHGTIVDHADVRRMIMRMKVMTDVARALCLDTAVSLDMASATCDREWVDRAAFLTPIAKAFCTEVGCEVADLGIQVHGGAGYVEETGIAQLWRDVRVTRIYEGTNGIQAMDLVGRKLADQGATARNILQEISRIVDDAGNHDGKDLAEVTRALGEAVRAVSECTESMVRNSRSVDRHAGATSYLRALALTLGGSYLLRGVCSGISPGTVAAQAVHYARRILPEVPLLARVAAIGSDDLYRLSARDLAG